MGRRTPFFRPGRLRLRFHLFNFVISGSNSFKLLYMEQLYLEAAWTTPSLTFPILRVDLGPLARSHPCVTLLPFTLAAKLSPPQATQVALNIF